MQQQLSSRIGGEHVNMEEVLRNTLLSSALQIMNKTVASKRTKKNGQTKKDIENGRTETQDASIDTTRLLVASKTHIRRKP